MSAFKYEGNQTLWLVGSDDEVVVCGRAEFFNGKQPRYYVVAENGREEWVNEDNLTDVEPVLEQPAEELPAPQGIRSKAKLRDEFISADEIA